MYGGSCRYIVSFTSSCLARMYCSFWYCRKSRTYKSYAIVKRNPFHIQCHTLPPKRRKKKHKIIAKVFLLSLSLKAIINVCMMMVSTQYIRKSVNLEPSNYIGITHHYYIIFSQFSSYFYKG